VEYNTAEIRQVAKGIGKVASSVDQISSGDLKRVLGTVDGTLEGQTANAIIQAVTGLRRDVSKLAGGLNGISGELYALARRIDAADAAAKAAIQNK